MIDKNNKLVEAIEIVLGVSGVTAGSFILYEYATSMGLSSPDVPDNGTIYIPSPMPMIVGTTQPSPTVFKIQFYNIFGLPINPLNVMNIGLIWNYANKDIIVTILNKTFNTKVDTIVLNTKNNASVSFEYTFNTVGEYVISAVLVDSKGNKIMSSNPYHVNVSYTKSPITTASIKAYN